MDKMDFSVMSNENKVTSIEELKRIAFGEIIELPAFAPNSHFFAKLKRPSLLSMVKTGKIPNELLTSANELFVDGIGKTSVSRKMDTKLMEELFEIMDVICEEAFIEPKYKEIVDAGIELTDEQRMFIFNYAQAGVKALESFRQ